MMEKLKFLFSVLLTIIILNIPIVAFFNVYDIYIIKSNYEDKYQTGRESVELTSMYGLYINLPTINMQGKEAAFFDAAKNICRDKKECSDIGINIDGVIKTFEVLDFYRRLGFCIDEKNKVVECK